MVVTRGPAGMMIDANRTVDSIAEARGGVDLVFMP